MFERTAGFLSSGSFISLTSPGFFSFFPLKGHQLQPSCHRNSQPMYKHASQRFIIAGYTGKYWEEIFSGGRVYYYRNTGIFYQASQGFIKYCQLGIQDDMQKKKLSRFIMTDLPYFCFYPVRDSYLIFSRVLCQASFLTRQHQCGVHHFRCWSPTPFWASYQGSQSARKKLI